MRKWSLFLALYFCLCLLFGCAGGTGAGKLPSAQPGGSGDENDSVTLSCRIVQVEDGVLLLAEQGEKAGTDIYTLPVGETPVVFEDPSVNEMKAGALVEICCSGMVPETYPMQLAEITEIRILSGGFDDRCRLYLDVLEDLWKVDEGLNSGITELGVDLSATSLTPSEQSAVAWAFGGKHGLQPIQGTFDQLVEQGYITGSAISTPAPKEGEGVWYQWVEGCLFSITEKPTEGVYSLKPVTFDAEKWRSGLGAYYFADCTALQTGLGTWSEYQIGSQAIS